MNLWKEVLKGLFITLLVVVLIAGLISIVSKQMENADDLELISIANSTQISGNFFLASGIINEEPVFYFYTKDNTGQIRLRNRRASRCAIYEDITGDQKPYMRFRLKWDTGNTAEFHIPPGSILRTFNLDAREVK